MKRFNFFLLIIILFAAAIWLAAIFNWGNYCFDELVSVSIAQKPLGEMWHYLKWPVLGFGMFAVGWLWALGTSFQIVSASRKAESASVPPRLN